MNSVGLTDIGKIRIINEDSIYISDKSVGPLDNLYIVADGMGGHNAGDIASKEAVERTVNKIKNYPKSQNLIVDKLLKEVIKEVNTEIYNLSKIDKTLSNMGTTFVVLTIFRNKIYIANIGDSRVYILNNNEINQLTIDHSKVYELYLDGEYTKEEINFLPNKNEITRALGYDSNLLVDTFIYDNNFDKILMCTDGLTNELFDKEILEISNEYLDIYELSEQLLNKANEKGGKDNISLILIEE